MLQLLRSHQTPHWSNPCSLWSQPQIPWTMRATSVIGIWLGSRSRLRWAGLMALRQISWLHRRWIVRAPLQTTSGRRSAPSTIAKSTVSQTSKTAKIMTPLTMLKAHHREVSTEGSTHSKLLLWAQEPAQLAKKAARAKVALAIQAVSRISYLVFSLNAKSIAI